MLPFAGDPLHLLDKPLLGHHGDGSLPALLPLPGLGNSSPFFSFSPPVFDHELLNDLSLLALPPQISPLPPPQHPALSRPAPGDASRHKDAAAAPPPKRVVSGCYPKDDGTAGGPAAKGAAGDHGGHGAGGRARLRKDRHSKINTSQGLRDRRMRLSLDVARKFFDLQDMLGFDKASKTVDWLLTSSKPSILEITGSSSFPAYPDDAGPPAGHAKSESSTTECEAISTGKHPAAAAVSASEKKTPAVRRTRKTSAHPTPPSRESRQMARARARERTKEKRMQKGGGSEGCQLRKAELESSSSALNALGEESAGTYTLESSGLQVAKDGRPPCPLGQCNKSSSNSPSTMVNNGEHGPTPILDYNKNTVLVEGDTAIFIQEQYWEAQTPGNLEEQRINLADAQLQPWIWELAFNSFT